MNDARTGRPAFPVGDAATLLVLAGALLVLLWTAACAAALEPWNPPRLAAAYALAFGQELYPDPASGAQLGWFYGPGFAFWLWPVTLIRSPGWALCAALLYNAATLLAAIAWTLRPAGLGGWRLAAATAFTGLMLFAGGLTSQNWLTNVHVDAPCLVFSLVAAGAAVRLELTGRRRWLHLAALAAVAACWTKQSAAILPVAILLRWVWPRRAGRAFAWLGAFSLWAVLATAALAWIFDPVRLFFYTVRSHSLNPWKTDLHYGAPALFALLIDTAPWLALHVLVRLGEKPRDARAAVVTAPLATAPEAWLWYLGWAQLPVGFLASLKAGGGLNTAHGLIFLLLAVVLRAFRLRLTAVWRLGGAIMLAAVALAGSAGRLPHWRPDPYQDKLLHFAAAHRGRLYLPANPLITLLTDRRVYPFDDALYCLELIGHPVEAGRVRRAVPADPLILYDPIAPRRDVLKYFPGTKPASIYRLAPEFTVYQP